MGVIRIGVLMKGYGNYRMIRKLFSLFTFLTIQCCILSFRSCLTKLRDQLRHSFRILLRSKSIALKTKPVNDHIWELMSFERNDGLCIAEHI
jgi:hypothetical protein